MDIFKKNTTKVFRLTDEQKSDIEDNISLFIDEVCKLIGVERGIFLSGARKFNMVEYRHIVLYYIYTNYDSIIERRYMSRIVGFCGNTTMVIYAITKAKENIEMCSKFKKDWGYLCDKVKPIPLNDTRNWAENEEFLTNSDKYFESFMQYIKDAEFTVKDFRLFFKHNHFPNPIDNTRFSHVLYKKCDDGILDIVDKKGGIYIYKVPD